MATNPFLEAINSGKTVPVTGGGGGDNSNPFLQAVQSVPTTTPQPQIITPQAPQVSFFDNAKNFFTGFFQKKENQIPQNVVNFAKQELTKMQVSIPTRPVTMPTLDLGVREPVSAKIKPIPSAAPKDEPLVLPQYREVIDVYRDVADGKERNVIEKFAKGVQESFRFKPFIGSIEDVTNLLNQKDSDIVKKAQALYPYSEKSSIAYQAGVVLAQIPEFAAEFLLTGGIFAGAKTVTIKTLTKIGMPSLVQRAAGTIIGGVAQGTVGGLPRIAYQTVEYSLPKTTYQLVESQNGKTAMESIEKAGDSFPKALAKAWGVTAIDYVTERMGVLVENPLGLLKKATFGKWLAGNGVITPSAIQALQKGIAWNGIIGEVFEEELAELGQAPIEGREYKAPFVTPEGTERLLVETLGIGAFGGISTISDFSLRQAQKVVDRKIVSEKDIVDYLKTHPQVTIVTPQQARDNVIGTPIEGTTEGNEIIKATLQAEEQGKNIRLEITESGKINIDLVEIPKVEEAEEESSKEEVKLTSTDLEFLRKWVDKTDKATLQKIKIDKTNIAPTKQFAKGLSEEKLKEMADYIEKGDGLPPIIVEKAPIKDLKTGEIVDGYYVRDGIHRIAVFERLGFEEIPALVYETENKDLVRHFETVELDELKKFIGKSVTIKGDGTKEAPEVTKKAEKTEIPGKAEAAEVEAGKAEVPKAPKAPTVKGEIPSGIGSAEELNKITKDKFGKNVDDSTQSQLKEALQEYKKPLAYSLGIEKIILKKASSYTKGIESVSFEDRPNLFWGNIQNKTFTDGYVAIVQTYAAQEINNTLLEKERKSLIKSYQRSEVNFAEAEKFADQHIAKQLETKYTYPDLQKIIPKEYSTNKAEIHGFKSLGWDGGLGVYLSDGITWAMVSADKLAFMQKYFPNAEMRLTGQLTPVVFLDAGSIVGVMMPIRTDETVNPFEPEKKAVKPPAGEKNLGFNPINLEEPESPKAQKEVEKIVKQSEIAKALSEKLNVPIRRGKFRAGGAIGIFKQGPKVIRTKAGGISTIFHESGHFIDDRYGFSKELNITERQALMEEYANKYSNEPDRQKKEGFAEYIRFKLTGQDAKIQRMAPEFDKAFQERINTLPEVKEVLDIARVDFKRWNDQPAVAKVLSQISVGQQGRDSLKDRIVATGHDLYTAALDDLHPLSEFSALGKKKLGNIPSTEDPYILARNLRGWIGKADLFLNKGTFGKTFWKVENGRTKMIFNGKSYAEIMKPIEESGKLDEFRVYIVAQRIVYDLAPRKIQTGISLKDAQAALEELGAKNPEFEGIAQERRDYKDRLLQYVAESGLIGPEGLKAIKELNKYHVPFYRVMEESQSKFLGKTKMAGNIANPIKRIKGSEREIIDPFESDVKDTYAIINAAERNNIGVAMANVSQKDYELGRLFEKVDKPLKPIKVDIQEVFEKAFKDNGMDIVVVPEDLAEIAVTLFRPTYATGPNMLNVNIGDKKYVFQVDPDLFKAIQGLNIEDVGIIMRILGMPAKVLRAGATLNLDFAIRNPVRDQFSAFVYSKYGYLPGVDLIKGVFELFKKGDTYNLWKAAGGQHSMLVSLDREVLQKNFNDILASKGAKALEFVKHPLKALQLISELTEQGTRLGEMRQAVRKGVDPISGAFASREVTLDFARIGAKTRAFNLIIAFFNANVQGSDKMIRSFRFHPLRTLTKVLLGITLPSILLYFANRDDPRWDEIPQWQKDLFWIILTKDHIWRIHNPFELGIIFGSIPERALEILDKKNPKLFSNLMKSVANGATPGLLPTAIVPIIENITNYSFFLDRPIVSRSLENLSPEEQAGTYTSEFAKILGQALHYSPAKIDNLVRGYTAGLGKYAVETIDKILKGTGVVNKPAEPTSVLEDAAVVRAFLIREPIGSGAESVNRLYEIYGTTNSKVNTLKKYAKEGNLEKADWYVKQHPEIQYANTLSGAVDTFSDMNKAVQQIRNSRELSPEEKRQKIDEIGRLQVEIAQKVLTAINEKP